MKSTLIAIFTALILSFVGTTPLSTHAHAAALGTIDIPAIGVSAPIQTAVLAEQYWDMTPFHMNVAHLQHMPAIGTPDNVALGAHSTDAAGNPDIFYALDQLQIGDVITVTSGGVTYSYAVGEKLTVPASDLSILYPTGTPRLTLFTCQLGSFSNGAFQNRTVIYAYPV